MMRRTVGTLAVGLLVALGMSGVVLVGQAPGDNGVIKGVVTSDRSTWGKARFSRQSPLTSSQAVLTIFTRLSGSSTQATGISLSR